MALQHVKTFRATDYCAFRREYVQHDVVYLKVKKHYQCTRQESIQDTVSPPRAKPSPHRARKRSLESISSFDSAATSDTQPCFSESDASVDSPYEVRSCHAQHLVWGEESTSSSLSP